MGRGVEWTLQSELADLLTRHLDPSSTWFTSLENRPLSRISGMLQGKRGVKSGVPDVQVFYRHKPSPRCPTHVVFVELKAPHGVASKSQKRTRLEMLPTGVRWWMARTARAAMTAFHLSGVPLINWEPPARLEPWEGPFSDPAQRLPQHPEVAAERREAARRYRLRKELREREAALLAAERRIETDFPTSAPGGAPVMPGPMPPQPFECLRRYKSR